MRTVLIIAFVVVVFMLLFLPPVQGQVKRYHYDTGAIQECAALDSTGRCLAWELYDAGLVHTFAQVAWPQVVAAQLVNPVTTDEVDTFLSSNMVVSEEADEDAFTFIFGPRPFGPRDFAMKRRQQIWDAQKERFGGLVDRDFDTEALLHYQAWGLGLPVVWKEVDGDEFVAFPEARYFKPVYVPVSTSQLFAGVVLRTWHLDSIAKGFCVAEVDRNFPDSVLAKNQTNCDQ